MIYKSVITIYSEFDPSKLELSELAREAEDGSAICNGMTVEQAQDKDVPVGVLDFYKDANV